MLTSIATYIDLGTAYGLAKARGDRVAQREAFDAYAAAKNGEWGAESRDKASEAFYAASQRVAGSNVVTMSTYKRLAR